MARDLVKRNVVELTEVPTGRAGRRSKSLTPKQVDDVLTKTATDRLHTYIVVSLLAEPRSFGRCAGSMCTSRRVDRCRRTWRCGGPYE
jgi:hypothetical protein